MKNCSHSLLNDHSKCDTNASVCFVSISEIFIHRLKYNQAKIHLIQCGKHLVFLTNSYVMVFYTGWLHMFRNVLVYTLGYQSLQKVYETFNRVRKEVGKTGDQ